MPLFLYRAMQGDGTVAEGQIEAGGRQDAFRQMEGRGLRPISLAEHRGKPKKIESTGNAQGAEHNGAEKTAPFKFSFVHSNRISPRVLENFTRLLSSLLSAGVPLSRALVILCKEAASPAARSQWQKVHDL